MNQDKTYFSETQKFQQKWLWVLLIMSCLLLTAIFGHAIFMQLVLGQPWGNRPASDLSLVSSGLISIIFSYGMTYLFKILALVTEVRDDGLYIQYIPFKRRKIAYQAIRSASAIEYKPIKEYGGWGIRYSKKGKAYNVSGNHGVQLEFYQGKPLLIGSQQAEVLSAAINSHINTHQH